MVYWLLQNNLISPKILDDIIEELNYLKINWKTCHVAPFGNEITFHRHTMLDDIIIPYGSSSLLRILNDTGGCKGLFFNSKTLRVDSWIKNSPHMLNNQENTVILFAENFNYLGHNDIFIRPVEDLKLFTGFVQSELYINEWIKKLLSDKIICPLTLFAISRVHMIDAEYRCFIVGGKVIDISQYKRGGEKEYVHIKDEHYYTTFQKLADSWLPDDVVCMDVAFVNDEYKIIEFNCLNGSGFYDNDITKVIRAVTLYTKEKRFKNT